MLKVVSTNIVSPLGMSSQENWRAVMQGRSALRRLENYKGIPLPFVASVFTPEQVEELAIEGFTRFESLAIRSIAEALTHTDLDVHGERTIFILSTTKADVEELGFAEERDGDYHRPALSAQRIAEHIGIGGGAIVCCNACISGVSAQILADRLISAGHYNNAVVCGADLVSSFTASGFLSFKSLSNEACRPFDADRQGLNLGEAAATIVFTRADSLREGDWLFERGEMDNDAFHLSTPAPSGEGARKVLEAVMKGRDVSELAFVSAHGTATMFNDQMESVAIEKAGLSAVPLTALKGWFGHTLGASGVLEVIFGMMAVSESVVLPLRGFSEIGVSGKVNVSSELRATDKNSFLKMISGFGGCNAAALYRRVREGKERETAPELKEAAHSKGETAPGLKEAAHLEAAHSMGETAPSLKELHRVHILPDGVTLDGRPLPVQSQGAGLLSEIYRKYVGDYPKYHKMDALSRLAFLATELLLSRGDVPQDAGRATILFNRTSSVVADRCHLGSIAKPGEFYPSPSVFLGTLPNIATGEIAIRHGYTGETSLYITDFRDEALMKKVVSSSFSLGGFRSLICGFVDCEFMDGGFVNSEFADGDRGDRFEADLKILVRNN
mgnify:FL=1